MASSRGPRPEFTAEGAPLLRVDDVLVLRPWSGAWLIDFTTVVAGSTRHSAVSIGRHRDLDRLLIDPGGPELRTEDARGGPRDGRAGGLGHPPAAYHPGPSSEACS